MTDPAGGSRDEGDALFRACGHRPIFVIAERSGQSVSIALEVEPHPDTAGVYGGDGTVAQYLAAQGAQPYVAASDR